MREILNDIDEVIKAVLIRNVELSNRVSCLEMEKASLEEEKVYLETKKASLEKEKAFLEAEIAKLRNELSCYAVPQKDSHNSSIPPGKESIKAQIVRRTRSLRTPSGRPSGGQPGHKGSTLLINPVSDDTKMHVPQYCSRCGNSLEDILGKEMEVRQSIDIPLPVCQIITNHVSIEKKCTCGCRNRGSFPAYVKPGVSYGVNMHALVAYLSTVQHIPFKRLTTALKDLYGIEISQGSVSNILNRMRKQSLPGYEAIRNRIATSGVVGADETGENVNGKLQWMWTFQNEVATYIFQHASRGKAAIDSQFPAGLSKSILVTDRHASYFNMETAGHQLCLAHLLRDLIYMSESNPEQTWAPAMLNLLRDSIHWRKSVPFGEINTNDIKDRFNVLINQNNASLDKKSEALRKSLVKHKEHIFQFLEREDVPYDNNASERAIRPLKVKQKVSGMFKSNDNADAFCQLHSIVDTAKKNNQDPFAALVAIAENITKRDHL
jgi:transposase